MKTFLPLATTIPVALAVTGLILATAHVACGGDEPTSSSAPDAANDVVVVDRKPPSMPSDAGTDGDASLLDAAFLLDPAIWREVANEPCSVFEGKVSPDPFPKRVWTSCGAGCRVSPGPLPIEGLAASVIHAATARYVDGDLLLLVPQGLYLTAYVQQVTRLSDDTTVAAAQVRGPLNTCLFGTAYNAPSSFTVANVLDDGGGAIMFGRGPNAPGSPIKWQATWLPYLPISEPFMLDLAHGVFAGVGVALVESLDAGSWSLADIGPGSASSRAADRDRAILSRRLDDGGGILQAITADGSVSAMMGAFNDTPISLASDGSHVAWLAASEEVGSGAYVSPRLRWAPIVAGALGPIEESPIFTTATSGSFRLALHGDYAATVGCETTPAGSPEDPTCALYVVQLSTKKVVVLQHRPGPNLFTAVLGLSPTEVIIVEIDNPQHPPFGVVERLLRIELTALESLGW